MALPKNLPISTTDKPRLRQSTPKTKTQSFKERMPMINYPCDSQSQPIAMPSPIVSTRSGYISDDSLLTKELRLASDVRTH